MGGIAALASSALVDAATTELIVVDRHTGLAISGFDPVAYFTDAAPRLGLGNFEYEFAGVVWRFHNQGNRAAFMADPKVYMPQFGGYDPVAVVRGVSVPGDPRLWLVNRQRLYLFDAPDAREAFAANPDGVAAAAERHWASVVRTLSP